MKSKVQTVMTSVALATLTASCSTTFKVEKIPAQLPKEFATPGIYYWLPKTEIQIGFQGYVIATKTSKKLDKGYKKSVEFCIKQANKDKFLEYDPVATKSAFKIEKPLLETNIVKDLENGYRLAVDFSRFGTFKHTLELSRDGIINTVSSDITNTGAEIILSSVTALKDTYLASKEFVMPESARVDRPPLSFMQRT